MTKLGKYEIIEEIGRGGFAVVYRARDTVLDRIVALKLLHPYWAADTGFVARFRREARAAAKLRHPHVVTVYDAGEFEGQLYIAMEYVPGRTLRALLEEEGPLALEQVLPILEQTAEALDYAHAQGVVHRDVKPSNVMVEETERGVRATLMDFGLVKAMTGSSVLTSQGTLLGSPEYMAPEQADPERVAEIGPATDRYALGIVAYQMLTGRVPFPGNTSATLNAHEHKPVPPPRALRPGLSRAVEATLLKMLAKSPTDRFASAHAFVARLRGAPPRPRRRPIPTWAWWAAAGGAALVVLLGLGLALAPRLFGTGPASTEALAERPTEVSGGIPAQAPTGPPTEVATAVPSEAAAEAPAEMPTETPTKEPADEPTPVPVVTRTRPVDEMVMVYVPAGEFEMGSTEGNDDERPVHTVALDGFWIDRTEVTNAQYQRCVEAGDCSPPIGRGSATRGSYYGDSSYDDSPVIQVTWYQAADYCAWAEARLPTEAEWEYAARGPEGRVFPWGDEFDGTRLNYCDANCPMQWTDEAVDDGYADTAPVGSYPGGASWCGALDIAGNVYEWVGDWYEDYPSGRQVSPTGPSSGEHRVHRGGSWYDIQTAARCAKRVEELPVSWFTNLGFRCARPALEPGATWPRPADGMVMVHVPGGTFQMGSDESDPDAEDDEFPQHPVTLDGFWIDQTEVTKAQFAAFLSDQGNQTVRGLTWLYLEYENCLIEQSGGEFRPKSGYGDRPVVVVSWYGAKAYCEWVGARLPTEAEWEYAARGPDNFTYPWGNGPPDNTLLNYDRNTRGQKEVGSYPGGASWCGALDMAGNVWEWVADWYDDYPSEAQTNPTGPETGYNKVMRGGSSVSPQGWVRAADRSYLYTPDSRSPNVGFRCVGQPGE